MDKDLIYGKICAVIKDMSAIGKNKRCSQGASFNFRGIDDVYNALNPLFSQHGVFVCPEVLERIREERTSKNGGILGFVTLRVKYTFYAEDGSNVVCIVDGEAMDSGDKATSKAMSIAMKYALFQVFCIPTEEMEDPDAQTHQPQPRQAPPQPQKLKPLPDELDSLLQSAANLVELSDIYKANKAKAAAQGYGKEWDVATTARKNQLTQGS